MKPIFLDSYQESVALALRALGHLFARMNTSLPQKDQEAIVRLVTNLISQSTFGPVRKLSRRMIEPESDFDINTISDILRKAI